MLEASGKAGPGLPIENHQSDPFVDSAYLELKRAERYRLFLSIITLDLGFGDTQSGDSPRLSLEGLLRDIRSGIRAVDSVGIVGRRRLTVVLPETGRQGAAVAARRVADLVRNRLTQQSQVLKDQVLQLEMASYPDAAGTRSVADLLDELKEMRIT